MIDSTSAGKTLNPEALIMSFLRSSIAEVALVVHAPDVAGAEEAVGAGIASAVASGRFQ